MLNQFLCVYINVLSDGASLFSVFLQLFFFCNSSAQTVKQRGHFQPIAKNKKQKSQRKCIRKRTKERTLLRDNPPPLQNQAAAKTPSIISLQITVTHLDGLALVQWWWWWVEGGGAGGGLHWQMGAWSLSGIWVQRHSMRPPQSIALAARPLERASVSSGERRGRKKKKIHGGAKDQWGTRGH